jgi:hypothetical protein
MNADQCLFGFDASRGCLVFVLEGRGAVQLHVSAIERCGYWEPRGGLERALRESLPIVGQPPPIVTPNEDEFRRMRMGAPGPTPRRRR